MTSLQQGVHVDGRVLLKLLRSIRMKTLCKETFPTSASSPTSSPFLCLV